MQPLLEIQDLKTVFSTARGVIKAVDGVSLTLCAGETLGIVGESGCGNVRKRGRFYLILFNKQNFHTCTVYMQ